jgi:hypothetical protein
VIHEGAIEVGAQQLIIPEKLGVEGLAWKEKDTGWRQRAPTFHSQSPTSNPVKSAYELAMERLEKEAPTVTLTEQQKAEIAESIRLRRRRSQEKELFLRDEIAKGRGDRQVR